MKFLSFNDRSAEENNIIVRPIAYHDLDAVEELDEESGNEVYDFIADYEEEVADHEYAWGIFLNQEIIGYCTLGGAEEYDEFDEYEDEDLCLSDVFIKEEYREMGYGKELVKESIRLATQDGQRVFATLLDDSLLGFYKPLGFRMIDKIGGVIYNGGTKR